MNWLNRIISRFKDKDPVPDKLFYPGQEITPKAQCEWISVDTQELRSGPKFGEVVQVVKYIHFRKGHWFINVTGYDQNYSEDWFAPVITDKQLEKMLKEVDTITTVTHGTF